MIKKFFRVLFSKELFLKKCFSELKSMMIRTNKKVKKISDFERKENSIFLNRPMLFERPILS